MKKIFDLDALSTLFHRFLDLVQGVYDLKETTNASLHKMGALTSVAKPFISYNKNLIAFEYRGVHRPQEENKNPPKYEDIWYDVKTGDHSMQSFLIRSKFLEEEEHILLRCLKIAIVLSGFYYESFLKNDNFEELRNQHKGRIVCCVRLAHPELLEYIVDVFSKRGEENVLKFLTKNSEFELVKKLDE